MGPKQPSAELWGFLTFQALPWDPLDSPRPQPCLLDLHPSPLSSGCKWSTPCTSCPPPPRGPWAALPGWAAGLPTARGQCSGSGYLLPSFLLLPVICPPTPGRF